MIEYSAWIPGDPHDSWSQCRNTNWMPFKDLMVHLDSRASLPGGNEGVVVSKRYVGSPEPAPEFSIP